MLPLFLAYSISIHKSQGMTLENVMINIGPNEFANGLTYTGITRVKKFENLTFNPFYSYERFKKIFRQKVFQDRLKHNQKEKASDANFESKFNTKEWVTTEIDSSSDESDNPESDTN